MFQLVCMTSEGAKVRSILIVQDNSGLEGSGQKKRQREVERLVQRVSGTFPGLKEKIYSEGRCQYFEWMGRGRLLEKCVCVCVLVAQSCQTHCDPHRLQPPRLPCPWKSPDKNVGVGCYSLLQGIFLTQGSNPGLLPCRQILYHPSHQGSQSQLTSCDKCII